MKKLTPEAVAKSITPLVRKVTNSPRANPRQLKPSQLLQTINSTQLGTVLSDAKLRRHRQLAGLRIGDEKTIDLLRYAGWLCAERDRSNPVAPGQDVLKTCAETARRFSVHTRTVNEWLTDPSFPGRAGSRGKADGHFPVQEIENWLKLRERNEDEDDEGSEGGELNAAIKREKLRKLKLFNDEAEGRLLDAEKVRRLFTRTNALASQLLYQLVAAVPACLPTGTAAAVKQEVRRAVQQTIDDVAGQLADSLKELAE